jgi:hypothetical protein
MRAIAAAMGLGMLLGGASAVAQDNAQPQNVSSTQPAVSNGSPDYSAAYCSGFFTSDRPSSEMRLISGEQSNSKLVFATRDFVYINQGSNQGVRVGDRYSVFRPETDPAEVQWFKWQNQLKKAMGTFYRDAGQLKVVNVQPNVSTAVVNFACDYLQRGDLIRPWQDRPVPPYKAEEQFDRFAPVSGKSVGMVVVGKDFSQTFGKLNTIYVNLGTNQGVRTGDYMRIFRYQGAHAETARYYENYQYEMYGYGGTPVRYKWNDLPREILGEGIVLSVGPNSSTLLITLSRVDIFAGDYTEVE